MVTRKEVNLLNISPKALAKKIVDHIEGDLYVMKYAEMDKLLNRWNIDIQKMIADASGGITYKAFFDGGATPNPGQMMIGGYIEEPFGARIYEYSYAIGYGTNNEAEYSSLLHLCGAIVSKDILKVRIHGDSSLVVNQVNGVYKAKDPRMVSFRDEVKEVLNQISDWNLVYIPRGQNTKADALT